MTGSIVTVEHFIAEQEREYPKATGAFTDILLQISLAAKVISTAVNRAGLIDILGVSGSTNVHGEEVQKLDDYANDVLVSLLGRCGSLSGMVSEEEEGFIHVPESRDAGPYLIAFDPLDGSSNIDVNISRGDDLLRLPEAERGSQGAETRPAPTGIGTGRGGIRAVRFVHHARSYDRDGRARLHARPGDRGVPALVPEPADSLARQEHLQHQRGLLR